MNETNLLIEIVQIIGSFFVGIFWWVVYFGGLLLITWVAFMIMQVIGTWVEKKTRPDNKIN